MSTATIQIIDDQDLSQVTYTGTWMKGGTSHENAGTVASSTVVGDSFTVSFNGTSIGVYGTLDSTSAGVVTTYSVDGAPPARATAAAVTGDTYRQLFWQSGTLPAQQHNLVVTLANLNANAGPGEGTVWFDYFQVLGALAALPPTSSSLSPSTSSNLSTRISSSSAVSATPSTQPDNGTHKKSSTGPIIGGVAAGLAVLILAITLILCITRRLRRRRGDSDVFIPPKKEIDGTASRISPGPAYMPLPQGNGRTNIPPSSAPVGPPVNNYTHFIPPPAPIAPPGPPVNNYGHQMPPSVGPSSYNPPPTNHASSNYTPTGQSVLYYNNQPQGSQYAPSSHSIGPIGSSASTTMPSRPSISKDGKSANPSLTLAWVPEPVQHVDSGLRVANPQSDVVPAEIPPVYTET